MTKKKRKKRKI